MTHDLIHLTTDRIIQTKKDAILRQKLKHQLQQVNSQLFQYYKIGRSKKKWKHRAIKKIQPVSPQHYKALKNFTISMYAAAQQMLH